MTLFVNTSKITDSEAEELFSAGMSLLSRKAFPCRLFVFQPHSEQGIQAVVQQGTMLLHGKMA